MPEHKVYNIEAKPITTETLLHPGSIIVEEIEARGWKGEDVHLDLGLSMKEFNDIVEEKESVTSELAVALQQVFDIDAEFWLRVQAEYDLKASKIIKNKPLRIEK